MIDVVEGVLRVLIVLTGFLVLPLMVGQLEHKAMAHMQSRVAPMYAGGFHGWAQLVADAVRFAQKEEVVPAAADRTVFRLAPSIALLPYFIAMLEIEQSHLAKETGKLLDWLAANPPEVVVLSNALLAGFTREIKKRLGCKVIAFFQGEDSFLDGLPEPFRTRCWTAMRDSCTGSMPLMLNTGMDRRRPSTMSCSTAAGR